MRLPSPAPRQLLAICRRVGQVGIVKHWSAKVVVNEQNVLGEGTLWDADTQRLWWVDIYGKRVFSYDPISGQHHTFETPDVVGTLVIGEDGNPVIAQGCGVARLELSSSNVTALAQVETKGKGYRLNDGKCDPWGRLWVGSIVEEGPKGSATLFCVDGRQRVTPLLSDVTVSNGLVWANDGRLFYYIDTPTQQVVAFDCDLHTLTLSNRRVVFEFPETMGSPDGMTMDAEGQLWIALFSGRSVVRLDPARGQLTGKVEVAAKNVTSCAFGGVTLSTLYISTARLATNPEELAALPEAGALFAVELPVSGCRSVRYVDAD
jgi:sugar lactone lactonase YvrE